MTEKTEGEGAGAAERPAPSRLPQPPARPPGALSPLRAQPPVVRPVTQPRSNGAEASRRDGGGAGPVKPTGDRRLVIGREINLSGEIASCDRLTVEGRVDANLSPCRELTVALGGVFKGRAAVDDAEIRGRFEGALSVKKRLVIRAGGKAAGTIRYGTIEVERGGQIAGDVQMLAPETEMPG